MAFDEELAQRVRLLLRERFDVDERRMFGGIGFMVAGNMACGVIGEELFVRLDSEAAEDLLERGERGARPFDFSGRPMKGWLFVAAAAAAEDDDLERWVRRAEEFAAGLPPK